MAGISEIEGEEFSAYLWGIETNKEIISFFKKNWNFQPTYEGLKHFPGTRNRVGLYPYFQPTYEGLKQEKFYIYLKI